MIRVLTVAMLLALPVTTPTRPCTSSTAECAEWTSLGGSRRALVYRSFPLDQRNDRVKRALVMVHDTTRDAAGYFQTAVAAGFLAGALDDTVVIAPRFASNSRPCADSLAPGEVSWPCEGNSWRSGGAAAGTLTSFDFMDEILKMLAQRSIFPRLSAIVVAGHSAGGQFVTRYEMANRVHDRLGVRVTYVVANPSSYAYPGSARPHVVNGRTVFGAVAERSCPDYDRWPYGLGDRTGYTARLTTAQLEKQLAERATTYLLGELDVLRNAAFDASCAAMAQGTTRLTRGQAFAEYVNETLGAHHTTAVVPLCGHNARCMFTAKAALTVLFPRVTEP